MNYYIITGTSKGLGEALAQRLISKNSYIFCISRKANITLIKKAKVENCSLEYIEYDLEHSKGIDDLVSNIFTNINKAESESVCLINNAGILDPIKPIGKCRSSEIVRNIMVNVVAPMILTSQFIKNTEDIRCKKLIINISSGAGKHPFFGWGSYCSSKAAMDMFADCVALEQQNIEYPVKIISFIPGIIDTDMQKQIRETNAKDFEQVERFRRFKEEGKLSEPGHVADKVIELINNNELKSGTIDIKDVI